MKLLFRLAERIRAWWLLTDKEMRSCRPPIPQICAVAVLMVQQATLYDGLFSSGFYLSNGF